MVQALKNKHMAWSTIHKACVALLEEQNYDKVEFILKELIKTEGRRCLEAVTESGVTPLHFAALSEFPHLLEVLLEYGCSVDAKNEMDETPLHWACSAGNFISVLVLVNCGASIFSDHKGDTPLHWAIESGNIKIAKYLAPRYKALVNRANNNGVSPLRLAQLKNIDSEVFA